MSIQALKVVKGGGKQLASLELMIQKAEDLAKYQEPGKTVILVVKLDDFRHFEEFKDAVVLLRKMHPRKSITFYARRQSKIPLIDKQYGNVGGLKRSITSLLKNAPMKLQGNLYLLGVNEEIFSQLREQAEKHQQPPPACRRPYKPTPSHNTAPPSPTASPVTSLADFSSRSLLELLTQVPVPGDLEKTFIGKSVAAQLVRRMIMLAASINDPVLILGDTGTGKEVVARAIHEYKFKGTKEYDKFVAVNCGAIPEKLFEAELFGYTRDFRHPLAPPQDKPGLWEKAGKGTLFLDEVGELKPDHQASILRVLQEGFFRRVGGIEDIKAEARILAATNRDLFHMAKTGLFREDLYYRLRGFIIRTPALREHPQDVPLLAQAFWQHLTQDETKTLPQEVLDELEKYGWPGNARELRTILAMLKAFFGVDNLTVEKLQAIFYYERQAITCPSAAQPGPEIVWRRVEYLRLLRRLEDVLLMIRITVEPLIRDKQIGMPLITGAYNGLRLHLNELEELLLHPTSFPNHLFPPAHELKGKIIYFHDLLPQAPHQALQYWRQELAGDFKLVLDMIQAKTTELAHISS